MIIAPTSSFNYNRALFRFETPRTARPAQSTRLATVEAQFFAIGQDGALFVGVNNALWAITPEGKKKWDYADFDLIDASPLALADGSVCVVSRFGQVIDFDSKRGPADPSVWYFYHGFGGTLSPAVGPGGTLFVAGHELNVGDTLYALQARVPLASSGWPKFRAGPLNTGRLAGGGP